MKVTSKLLDLILHSIFGAMVLHFHSQVEQLMQDTTSSITIVRNMTKWMKEVLIIKALGTLETFLFSDTSKNLQKGPILVKIAQSLKSFWHELEVEMLVYSI
jgi:hypothetical protein